MNQQTQTKPILISPPVQRQKEEPRKEIPKREEINQEEEKEEKKSENETPKQPFWTYMSICPLKIANKTDDVPSMMYMIPVLCADPNNMPKDFQIPPMPAITSVPPMTNMPYFFPYPFGMTMQNK